MFEVPPWPVGKEVKVVWRVGGSGGFEAHALGPDGQRLEPSWGPERHAASNWERPGGEWGVAFIIDTPGCWQLRAKRDGGTASLWVRVRS